MLQPKGIDVRLHRAAADDEEVPWVRRLGERLDECRDPLLLDQSPREPDDEIVGTPTQSFPNRAAAHGVGPERSEGDSWINHPRGLRRVAGTVAMGLVYGFTESDPCVCASHHPPLG